MQFYQHTHIHTLIPYSYFKICIFSKFLVCVHTIERRGSERVSECVHVRLLTNLVIFYRYTSRIGCRKHIHTHSHTNGEGVRWFFIFDTPKNTIYSIYKINPQNNGLHKLFRLVHSDSV